MRKVSILKIVLLAALLLMVAIFVNSSVNKLQQTTKEPLRNALDSLPGWNASPNISMGANIEEALKLDDYLFKTYRRDNDTVSLYIGYYRSAAKVGSAHDPLVCFTGQGWRIAERGKGTYQLPSPGSHIINYSTMVAEQQSDKEYILYWFQTNNTTSSGTFDQKVQMLWQRLRNNPREENAFVRVSTRMEGNNSEIAKKRALDFVNSFYPEFYRYVGK
ncbi:MAG: EpsI family protein [Desulfuromonadaceae bacterium]|nr:EpsI family protein [Desulfuromonadaceae bacterium]MDD5104836.1 EpsI family protein [Desulfuromonadaceae bacterium]